MEAKGRWDPAPGQARQYRWFERQPALAIRADPDRHRSTGFANLDDLASAGDDLLVPRHGVIYDFDGFVAPLTSTLMSPPAEPI